MAIKQSAVRGAFGPNFKVGDYFGSTFSATGNAAMTQDRLDLTPVFVFRQVTIDQLSFRLATVAVSSSVRLGVFRDDGAGRPGQLVVEASAVVDTTTGTGAKTVSCTSTILVPGLYWFGGQAEGGAPTVNATANNSPFTLSSSATTLSQPGLRVTHTGAFADLTGSSFSVQPTSICVIARKA